MTDDQQPREGAPPSIPLRCLERLSVEPLRYLGGRVNQHWLVERSGSRLVLRGYAREQTESADYEHEVLHRLHRLRWPVPQLVQEPIHELGRLWCLFTLLPGASRPEQNPEDRRARGRLLAELHAATSVDIGQRSGFGTADHVVRDPALFKAVRDYERLRPDVGHVLRWHLEKTLGMFERIPLNNMETVVLHSDFAPWNLLFDAGSLSGILDFESTHRNYRVSDFALAWRGYQHEVINGYEEVHRLAECDRQLLIPAFWSWLFLGVAEEIGRMISGDTPAHGFEWQVKQLLKRSPLHRVEPYPNLRVGH